MDGSAEDEPSALDVLRQMDRMLVSGTFKRHTRLSPLFKHIVEVSVAGRAAKEPTTLTEHEVGYAVFGQLYDFNSNDVRVNATHLRKQIAKYYEKEGIEDPIRIDIPRGAYRAIFSNNHPRRAEAIYREGLRHFNNFEFFPLQSMALGLFLKATWAAREHAPAHAALAEAALREAMYRGGSRTCFLLDVAEKSASTALGLQPKLWRAHVVFGALHCCRHEWGEAGECFDLALGLSSNKTSSHTWYMAYLLATGNETKALALARARAEERVDDRYGVIALAFLLYAARRFSEAQEAVRYLLNTNALTRILTTCIWMARYPAADHSDALEDASVERVIAAYNAEGGAPQPRSMFNLLKAVPFPGLYCLTLSNGPEDLKEFLGSCIRDMDTSYLDSLYQARNGIVRADPLRETNYWTHVQMALGWLAVGDKSNAIKALARAVHDGDPLTVLLDRWPIFDPLRKEAGFEAIIRDMKYPVTGHNG